MTVEVELGAAPGVSCARVLDRHGDEYASVWGAQSAGVDVLVQALTPYMTSLVGADPFQRLAAERVQRLHRASMADGPVIAEGERSAAA